MGRMLLELACLIASAFLLVAFAGLLINTFAVDWFSFDVF